MLTPLLAGVREQPGQLARVVGHRDEHRRASAGPGRRACRGWPGCRRRRGPAARPAARVAVRDRGDEQVELAAHLAEQPEHGGGVAGDDLLPQRRVAGRDPGDVAHALARTAPGARAGRRRAGPPRATASRCGRCEVRATARSCSSGVSRTGDGAAEPRPAPRRAPPRPGSDVGCGVTAQGRPSKSAALAASGPERSLPAIGCAADVAARRPAPAATASQRAGLDAADVGDHGVRAVSARATSAPEVVGRDRDDDELRRGRAAGAPGRRPGRRRSGRSPARRR